MAADVPKLLMTPELDRLARWLRLLGCDVAVYRGKPLAIYPEAYREDRVVVTRNRRIPSSPLVTVIQLEPQALEAQLQALERKLKLRWSQTAFFSRCGICNAVLKDIPKADVAGRVPDYVFKTQERFTTCPTCHRIYWAATHWDRARQFVAAAGLQAEM